MFLFRTSYNEIFLVKRYECFKAECFKLIFLNTLYDPLVDLSLTPSTNMQFQKLKKKPFGNKDSDLFHIKESKCLLDANIVNSEHNLQSTRLY